MKFLLVLIAVVFQGSAYSETDVLQVSELKALHQEYSLRLTYSHTPCNDVDLVSSKEECPKKWIPSEWVYDMPGYWSKPYWDYGDIKYTTVDLFIDLPDGIHIKLPLSMGKCIKTCEKDRTVEHVLATAEKHNLTLKPYDKFMYYDKNTGEKEYFDSLEELQNQCDVPLYRILLKSH